MKPSDSSIGSRLKQAGVTRRSFVELCSSILLTPPGLLALSNTATTPEALATRVSATPAVPIVWLSLQCCSGCSQTLLSSTSIEVGTLVMALSSLQFHLMLQAASGRAAYRAFTHAMKQHRGKYILVLEGSLPGEQLAGALSLLGRDAASVVREAALGAALTVAIGSCASWGGVASATPSPTGARAASSLLSPGSFIRLPGCPPNPSVLATVLLEYAATRNLPKLDAQQRPLFAYGRYIHDDCPRRPNFNGGRMARKFGDEKHRAGYCLFALGCKGPHTHAPCATRSFYDQLPCAPTVNGAPSFGCTEASIGFSVPAYQSIPVDDDKMNPLPVTPIRSLTESAG